MDGTNDSAVRTNNFSLERHCSNIGNMAVQAVEGPVRALKEFEHRTAARCIGLGVIQDVIFMVAPNKLPAVSFNPFLHDFKAGDGSWTTVNNITGNKYVIGLPVIEVLKNGLEAVYVAVYV
jgi:hypothetical protein